MKNKIIKGLPLCLAGLLFFLSGCQNEAAPIMRWQGVQESYQQVAGEAASVLNAGKQNDERWKLPAQWDNRGLGRTVSIKNQGDLGTCWAFAALGALESLWLPERIESFSVDHMVYNHGYDLGAADGGDFSMVLAYLTAWKGPVWESDDPYADGLTNSDAPVRGHLQEAQFLKGDRYAIKNAVMRYGAVQSSMHIDETLLYSDESSEYYSADDYAYYYDGSVSYNHDVLIIGWDDAYSRDHFAKRPAGDGAFICQNSWGEMFGDHGFFYVSYYDTAIAQNTLTYCRMDAPGVYDQIYQYDELGKVGQIGYKQDSAWGANVFTATSGQRLEAVSFYAMDEFTEYEIYIDLDPETEGFSTRRLAAQGVKRHGGYYTIDLEEPIALREGQRFAVIVAVTTPGSEAPLAAEYSEPESYTSRAQAEPGQSYISSNGLLWTDAGVDLESNLCIKAFTKL